MARIGTSGWLAAGALLSGIAVAVVMQLPQGPVQRIVVWLLIAAAVGLALGALLRQLLPEPCDTAPPALRKRYTREMMIITGTYMVLLAISLTLLKHVEGAPLRACVALLPVPPIVMLLRAMIRYIRDVDEMQQRIELQAICFATGLVSLVYFSGGLLQTARVLDVPADQAMIWVFPLICLTYGLAKAVVARRYR